MKKYFFYLSEIEEFKVVGETVRVIETSAAAQIHFLKKNVQSFTMYKNQIHAALHRLSRFYRDPDHPLLAIRKSDGKALLVITGEKGMVGGLYHNIVNEFLFKRNEYRHVWVIGSKGGGYLEEEGTHAEELSRVFDAENAFTAEGITHMSSILFNRFQELGLQTIDVLYPSFLSLARQQPATVQFLPFDFNPIGNKNAADEDEEDGIPICEPSKKIFFDILIKKYVGVFFAQLILEAKLSEFAARTVTAESAIKETEALVHSLKRVFRKEKHRVVTQKQIESFSVHQMV